MDVLLAPNTLRKVGGKIAEPYQDRIMTSVRDAIRISRSGAILAPTGSGKSLMAAAAVEDSIDLKFPILVLHPDVSLLRQNLAQFQELPNFKTARIACYIAKNENLADTRILRDTLNADVILASNMSLVNKLDNPQFRTELQSFGRRHGVVMIDEGHRAAADKLSEALSLISEAGGCGIVLTATPFRTDGLDPLDPFGASVEADLIGVAGYNEVLATGRTVPTRFDLAAAEFETEVGEEALDLIDKSFLALLKENKSIDQASSLAFSRFFKGDASKSDKLVASLIVAAVAKIWRRRAHDKNLTMVHCDSVNFAERLAETLATHTLPAGHSRHGEKPNVGFVVASAMRIWSGGKEVDIRDDLEWRRADYRQNLLIDARSGKFDILVNVSTLGTGTDLPSTDLSILACRERSIGPTKQISGRGERKDPNSDKKAQLFVDIGGSILNLYNDVNAMRHGAPERSRRHIRALSGDIRKQFEEWFDGDPQLDAKIQKRLRDLATRNQNDAPREEIVDEPDSSMTVTRVAKPFAFAPGIWAAGLSRPDWLQHDEQGKPKMFVRAALFIDLRESGVCPPSFQDVPDWLAIVYDEKTKVSHAFLCATLESALTFAAFMGISGSMLIHPHSSLETSEDIDASASPAEPAFVSPATAPQKKLFASMNAKTKDRVWPTQFLEPESKNDASVAITLRRNLLLRRMLEDGAHRLMKSVLKTSEFVHPLRALFLDAPDKIANDKMQLVAAYDSLMRKARIVEPDTSSWPFSVVTYDHSVLPHTREIFSAAGTRFRVLEDPKDIEKGLAILQTGLVTGTISGIGPDGAADGWLRQKAGLAHNTEAGKERDRAFRDAIDAIGVSADRHNVVFLLPKTQYSDLAKTAQTGAPTAPLAAAARVLIDLTEDAPRIDPGPLLFTAIAGKAESLELQLPLVPACIAYAKKSAFEQKRILQILDRGAKFIKDLALYAA